MDKLILGLLLIFLIILPSYALADPSTYLNIPPTNAFDKIHSDNGTITAQNFSMPLTIKGGSGISVKSQNGTHTLTITNTATPNTHNGSYNTTQANNVNINTGGSKINFINGTGATVHLQNSHSGNQVNVTVSATGTSSGVSSLNALTGALTIACVSGNTTCTTSGGNTITVNTGNNLAYLAKFNNFTNNNSIANNTKLYFDGGLNTYLSRTGINILDLFVGGTDKIKVETGGTPLYVSNYGCGSFAGIGGSATLTGCTNYALLSAGTDTFINRPAGSKIILREGNGDELTVNAGGSIYLVNKITKYNNINTAGWGVPAIYGSGRLTGLTGASGTVTSYTVGASDGTFEVSGDILATTSTSYDFLEQVTYTDETGTSRTVNLMFTLPSTSAPTPFIRNLQGPIFLGLPMTIHAKAGTSITIATNPAGTYTTVTYNIDGIIKQLN